MNNLWIIPVFYILFIEASAFNSDSRRRDGVCHWMAYENTNCSRTKFLCGNKKCIDRNFFCDHQNNCGDQSDEYGCRESRCTDSKRRCDNKCIPHQWFCDGIADCRDGSDEKYCDHRKLDKISTAMQRALTWLYNQSNTDSTTEVWGAMVDKLAVGLYFADENFVKPNNGTRKMIAYEVSIQFLSRLSRMKLKVIPSTDLASFVNAFLVSCIDPRKFHGIDIIQELRNRVNKENYTNPYVLLSLCNAGDRITDFDKNKLVDTFLNKRRPFWTDMQALSVMALVCAAKEQEADVDVMELMMELKQKQYRNGSVENLQTTALVLQALFSAQLDEDPDTFDERRALEQIVSWQIADGSFGNLINTYFVLPVLACQSLVNISSSHCKSVRRDEISALTDLMNRDGPKKRVEYSLWIGDKKDLERNLVLRVPLNMSLYGIMEIAAEIDNRYNFEYVVKDHKPYINAVSGFQDNPEKGKFWFLHSLKNGQASLMQESPGDVMPANNDHFVMWYRSGSWVS